jgi:pyruvate kinase
VARRTGLYSGVVPHVVTQPESVEQFIKLSGSLAKDLHLAASGDRIIVLAGHPIGTAGGTKGLIIEQIP